MAMSYNVRFWDTRERPGRQSRFQVRWTVNGRERSESFSTFGLAESRRAKLVTAAREGEPFDERTGLPASELRAIRQRKTWYALAHEYLEQRWDRTPGTTRRTLADAFATITPALVQRGASYPEPRVLRRALYSWAFNKNAWDHQPVEEWQRALDWIARNSLPVSSLGKRTCCYGRSMHSASSWTVMPPRQRLRGGSGLLSTKCSIWQLREDTLRRTLSMGSGGTPQLSTT